ncbi:hypothetical protein [Streptomyces capitiformicae]|uniref:hypothetical protein n=1 Tax=Streptomyces capitiformicae TaxID=2014920 RepID=UPI0016759B32|nr:hypothetical protein [Streptomyces capitiformicae]
MSDRTPLSAARHLLVRGCDVLRVPVAGECEVLAARDIVVEDGVIADVLRAKGRAGNSRAGRRRCP